MYLNIYVYIYMYYTHKTQIYEEKDHEHILEGMYYINARRMCQSVNS